MGMNKESKKASKMEEEEAPDAVATSGDAASVDVDEKPKKKKKKSKKEKKSKKRSLEEAEDFDAPTVDKAESSAPKTAAAGEDDTPTLTKEERRAARAAKKEAKSKLKSDLESKIPTVDSDGIPYNKIQIRRMTRRVKNGLDPIATEEEELELRQREKRERVEEEALYSEQQKDPEEEAEKKDDDDVEAEGETNQIVEGYNDQAVAAVTSDNEDAPKKKKKRHNPPSLCTKRAKAVPSNYTCMACNNECDDFTPHWIYDCPMKKTKKGCNQVAKRLRGLHDPPSRKVFVGGLPFECDEGLVKRFFEESMGENSGCELVHLKLLKFEDSKRCKGQAFLTFDSDEGAQLALKLNGSIWKDVEEPGTKSKEKKTKVAKVEDKKELRLKVSKVLGRHVTKQKRANTKG